MNCTAIFMVLKIPLDLFLFSSYNEMSSETYNKVVVIGICGNKLNYFKIKLDLFRFARYNGL